MLLNTDMKNEEKIKQLATILQGFKDLNYRVRTSLFERLREFIRSLKLPAIIKNLILTQIDNIEQNLEEKQVEEKELSPLPEVDEPKDKPKGHKPD